VKVILFAATGMVGQGVLRECLRDPEIAEVLAIGRSATGQQNAKLREAAREDLVDLSDIARTLMAYDACFFCLGVSSAGMKEEAYKRVTYDLTTAVARSLAQQNPGMTFLYVSGAGTDSSERGRSEWARVKGKTENDLLKLPFAAAYMLRPGYIQPMHGIRSKTGWYQALHAVAAPTYPLWKAIFGKYPTTTEDLGRAMLKIAQRGVPRRVLESQDIDALRGAGRNSSGLEV
jgi:uncharacterized protein YbjT (DUF2867 family)